MRPILCLYLALLLAASSTEAKKKKNHSGGKLDGATETSQLEDEIADGNFVLTTVLESDSDEADDVSKYIVVLKEKPAGAGADNFASIQDTSNEIVRSAGLRSEIGQVYQHTIRGFSIEASAADIEAIRADKNVRYVAEDVIMYADQSGAPTGVRRVEADKLTSWTVDPNVVAAVLDTGVDQDHPELNIGKCENFHKDANSCDDDGGHGTHVAGTVAGTTTGVAPGAEVWGIKVLHQGRGSWEGIAAGIDFVASQAIAQPSKKIVINMSLGGSQPSTDCDAKCDCGNDVLHAAVCEVVKLGVTVVVSAGNNGSDASTKIPASYKEVITVSAVKDLDGIPDKSDELASFSNYGFVVDIAAPGVSIYSSYLNGGYSTLSGTSMAAPHVTGAAVVYMSQNDALDGVGDRTEKVKSALLSAADAQDSTRGFSEKSNDGFPEPMLNVKNLESLTPAPFKLSCELEKGEDYEVGDTSAKIIVKSFDENGNVVKLKKKQYGDIEVVKISSGSVASPSFTNPRPKKGLWKPVMDLTTLDKNVFYAIKVTAQKQGHTASAVAKVRVRDPLDDLHVVSLKWMYHRGDNRWLQRITLNKKVDAQIRILTSDPSNPAKKYEGSAPMSGGTILFGFRDPPIGTCHSTKVIELTSPGLEHAKEKDAKDYGTTLY